MSIWYQAVKLNKLELLRDERRKRSKRIAFDCYNLKAVGDRACCSKGKHLGRIDDSFSLESILAGITPSVCKNCHSFDSG